MNTDNTWEKLGETDPYYGVLSHEKYHRDRLDQDALDEFFASGEKVIEHMLSAVRANLDINFEPQSALDFGCGVGRLTLPLGAICSRVVGVDVSEAMLTEARQNSTQRNLSDLTFVKSDDTLSQVDGAFDFMCSMLVFQHIQPQRGERLFQQLISRLNPGGVAALHVIYASDRSQLYQWGKALRNRLPIGDGIVNVLKGRAWNTPIMQLNVYDLNRLFRIFREAGGGQIYVEFSYTADHYDGVVLYLQKADPEE